MAGCYRRINLPPPFSLCIPEEVSERAILKAPLGSSAGLDGIPAGLLRLVWTCPDQALNCLTLLIVSVQRGLAAGMESWISTRCDVVVILYHPSSWPRVASARSG